MGQKRKGLSEAEAAALRAKLETAAYMEGALSEIAERAARAPGSWGTHEKRQNKKQEGRTDD